jgi:hypothetical protein
MQYTLIYLKNTLNFLVRKVLKYLSDVHIIKSAITIKSRLVYMMQRVGAGGGGCRRALN